MWGALIAGMGMLMSSGGSRSAAGKVERTASINANLIREETGEEVRRLERDIAQSEGLMTAMSAASGVQMSGSRSLYAQDTRKENRAQLDWLKRSGFQKAEVVRRGGQLQSSQLKSKSASQAFQGFGKIAQGLYSNYNTGTG